MHLLIITWKSDCALAEEPPSSLVLNTCLQLGQLNSSFADVDRTGWRMEGPIFVLQTNDFFFTVTIVCFSGTFQAIKCFIINISFSFAATEMKYMKLKYCNLPQGMSCFLSCLFTIHAESPCRKMAISWNILKVPRVFHRQPVLSKDRGALFTNLPLATVRNGRSGSGGGAHRKCPFCLKYS